MKKVLLQQLLLLSVATFGAPLFAVNVEEATREVETTTKAEKAAEQAVKKAQTAKEEADKAAQAAKETVEKAGVYSSSEATSELKEGSSKASEEQLTAQTTTAAAAEQKAEELTKATEALKAATKAKEEAEEALARAKEEDEEDEEDEKRKASPTPTPTAAPKKDDVNLKDKGDDKKKKDGETPAGENKEWTNLEIGCAATAGAVVCGVVGLGVRNHYKKQVAKLIEQGEDVKAMGFFAIMAA